MDLIESGQKVIFHGAKSSYLAVLLHWLENGDGFDTASWV